MAVILHSMLLRVAWTFLAGELALAVIFGFVFWYFWSHATITAPVRVRAMLIYILGCALIILFTLSVTL